MCYKYVTETARNMTFLLSPGVRFVLFQTSFVPFLAFVYIPRTSAHLWNLFTPLRL
jgi:hypothetical protein